MLLLHIDTYYLQFIVFLYDIQKLIIETEYGDGIIILNYYPLLVAIL